LLYPAGTLLALLWKQQQWRVTVAVSDHAFLIALQPFSAAMSAILSVRVRVRVRVIQMVFLLLCMAEPDKTTEKSTGKQPHGRER
jgi:uncharacterized membrane protein